MSRKNKNIRKEKVGVLKKHLQTLGISHCDAVGAGRHSAQGTLNLKLIDLLVLTRALEEIQRAGTSHTGVHSVKSRRWKVLSSPCLVYATNK